MKYPRGTEAIITDPRVHFVGRKGKIITGPDSYGDYIIEFDTPGSLGYDYDFFKEHQFTVQNIWVNNQIQQLPTFSPAHHKNFYDEYIATSSKQRCNHKWKGVLLLTSTVFDCELCGVKKEEVEKEHIGIDFGVPF